MRKLLPALFAAVLVTPLLTESAGAAFNGMSPGLSNGPGGSAGAAPRGGGGFNGGSGGVRGGTGAFRGGTGNFRGGDFRGGNFRGGFRRGGFRNNFGVVFADPWYDPFWPYGYGFGWGYGWYGPPYVERRVTEYAAPPVDYGPPPEQFWYYCDQPDGYYPYVKSCNHEWQSVPVTPPGGPQQSQPPQRSSLPEGSAGLPATDGG